MQLLTREAFHAASDEYDELVKQTPDTDLFCTSSHWVNPADCGLMGEPRDPWIVRNEYGIAALARGVHSQGWAYLQPLEGMWGLCNPFVGPDNERLARECVRHAYDVRIQGLLRRKKSWDVLFFSGIKEGSELFDVLMDEVQVRGRVRVGYNQRRYAASLEGGVDGFLSRRKRKFRANLRRARRKSREASIEVVEADLSVDPMALYDRILRTEEKSWKGIERVGITEGAMYAFYHKMIPSLMAKGLLRVLFARKDGEDVGYLFGGTFGGTFRGLQFSYAETLRDLSLGSVLQIEMIERLCVEESPVQLYDLGSEIDYKKNWAEEGLETVMIVVLP